MKKIDKVDWYDKEIYYEEINIIISKLNQLILSHNELMKIIESFYKEKVIYCIDDKLNKG